MYLIMGSTGNTGKPLAHALLNEGKKVRVISRDKNKVKDFLDKGAEEAIGEISEANFLAKTFAGATAVYAMIPPTMMSESYRGYQNQIAENIANAIEKNSVKYAVTLSSIGAHMTKNAGVVQGLHDFEQRLNKIKELNVLYLRAGYFMENLFGQIGTLKQMGFIASPLRASLELPIVATKDIAEVAAKKLLSLDFKGTGNVQYVLGQRDVTFNEIAQVLGEAIGKPDLKYMEATYHDVKYAMMHDWGITENAADTITEFSKSMNEGRVLRDAKRTPETTTPTSLEEFAHLFAYMYNQS